MIPTNVRPMNLDPVLPVLRRTITDANLLPSFKTVVDCIDSAPLLNATLASLKSAAYVRFGDRPVVKEFENGMTCRLRYFETAVTSLAAIVYNFVFGTIFSIFSLATFGQVKMFVDQMKRNWVHAALAVGAFGISCIGTFSPEHGIKANMAVGLAVGMALLQTLQGDVISKIYAAYQRNRQEIINATMTACEQDNIDYNREFAPLFRYLNEHLNNVRTVSDFANVIQGAAPRLPHVIPWATPENIINQLQQLASTSRSTTELEPIADVSSSHHHRP